MRVILISLAALGVAYAQTGSLIVPCNTAVQTKCSSICALGSSCYNLAANQYQLANFMADSGSSFAAINLSTARKPQPAILLTGQDIPCTGPFMSSNVAVYAPPCANGTFAAQMIAQGLKTQDIFPDVAAFFDSPTCGTTRACSVPSDCTGGVYLPYTNPATAAPAGSGNHCKMLSALDGRINYAIAHGSTIRMGIPGAETDPLNSCGYATPSAITEPQYEACVLPPVQALFDRYTSSFVIASFQVLVEPYAAMAALILPQMTIAFAHTLIVDFSTAIKAISPSTKILAAFTGPSYPVSANVSPANSDICFAWDWMGVVNASIIPVGSSPVAGNCSAKTQSTTHNYLDGVGWDGFNGSSDQSNNAYANELQGVLGFCNASYCQGIISNAYAGASPNNTVTMPWGVTQADPPRWAPYSSTGGTTDRPTEAFVYLGCLDVFWQPFRQQWATSFTRWVAANGGQFVSLFFTTPLFYSTAVQTNDNCQSGTATINAMSALSANNNALNWGRISALGPADLLQGWTTITGWLTVP